MTSHKPASSCDNIVSNSKIVKQQSTESKPKIESHFKNTFIQFSKRVRTEKEWDSEKDRESEIIMWVTKREREHVDTCQ